MTAQTYPHTSGDFTIIGPECFTDESASVISYMGENYYPQRQVTTVEELDALPVGSVVVLRDSKHDPHPAQKGKYGWRLPFVEGLWTAEKLLSGSESAEVVAP